MPYARKRATKPKRKGKPRKMAVPLSIKTYVKKTLNREMETKQQTVVNTFTLYNSNISTADFGPVLPPVLAGTGEGGRVGSTIKPIKLVIRGYVCYSTTNVSPQNDAKMLGARLFCFREKAISSYSASPGNVNLLDFGGASSAYSGSSMSWISPKNTDEFVFYCDKKMKILKPFGSTNNFTPSLSTSITSMNTTLFHPFTITLTQKHMPANLQYETTVATNYPINFAPMLALGYSDLLNASADTVNTQVGMAWCSTLYYKDA